MKLPYPVTDKVMNKKWPQFSTFKAEKESIGHWYFFSFRTSVVYQHYESETEKTSGCFAVCYLSHQVAEKTGQTGNHSPGIR